MRMRSRLYVIVFVSCCLLYANLLRAQQERIAILDFQVLAPNEHLQRYEWMSQGFAETLSDAFSRVAKFSVIERTRLSKILGEQRLQTTHDFDTSSIVSAGKILGVTKVLLGSCQVITGHLLVNMRIVDVETGKVEPIDRLPIIKPVDSVLFVQRDICYEILKQYNIHSMQSRDQVTFATSSSTQSVTAYEMLIKGIRFFNDGQYEDALSMYNAALKSDMFYGKAYYRRGQTYYAMERFDNAVQDYKRAENYLGADSVYTLIGEAYFRQGNYEKSAEALEKASALNPANQSIRRSLQQAGISLTKQQLVQRPTDTAAYDRIYEFMHGIAKVEKKGKFGFIDTSDKLVIPVQLEAVKPFRYGRAAFKLDGKWGFMDDFGKIVVAPKYDDVGDFGRLYHAVVTAKTGLGVINFEGIEILPTLFNQIDQWRWDLDNFIYATQRKDGTKKELWGCYDGGGRQVLPHIYNRIKLLSEPSTGTAHFTADFEGKTGVVDQENRIILPFRYDNEDCIHPYVQGYFATRINEKWGFVNLNGTVVIPHLYERVNDKMVDGYFQVKERGRWGLVDSGNQVKIALIYDNIEPITKGYWAVQKGGLWGVITESNKMVVDFEYEQMGESITQVRFPASFFKEHKFYVRVQKGGVRYYINEKNRCIWECPTK